MDAMQRPGSMPKTREWPWIIALVLIAIGPMGAAWIFYQSIIAEVNREDDIGPVMPLVLEQLAIAWAPLALLCAMSSWIGIYTSSHARQCAWILGVSLLILGSCIVIVALA